MALTIAVSCDHGGYELAVVLEGYLKENGYNVLYLGVNNGEKGDYAEQAFYAVSAIYEGKADKAVILCGTGIGISVAANKYPGIVAALCHDEYTARMASLHNNSNVLVLGGRTTGVETAKAILNTWLSTSFEGGRHIARLEKIDKLAKDAWINKLSDNQG